MTIIELRQKYPKFIFEKYEYQQIDNRIEAEFYYSLLPDHHFVHKIVIENSHLSQNLDNFIFTIGLSLIPSYWKATCSPVIEINAKCQMTNDQIGFWSKLFIKGMGEYYYKNQIDFTYKDFLTITASNITPPPPLKVRGGAGEGDINTVLVPIGGGKDSIVTLELLKPKYTVIPFFINPTSVMFDVIKIAGIDKYISVTSTLDPHLLELNQQGYLNGHVPITAFYTAMATTVAAIHNITYIAFSNERSSNEGNTEYLNQMINHQYSKSFEYEYDFHNYVKKYLSPDINYFSFLRPLYDLQITKIFSKFPQYFPKFTSCNSNFKLSNPGVGWCGRCPKCVSTAMLLAAWIGKGEVTRIMGSYPPELPENLPILEELLGIKPVKPFECVLTREEANLAVDIISGGSTQKYQMFLTSWLDNPNMPEEFSELLKIHLTP